MCILYFLILALKMGIPIHMIKLSSKKHTQLKILGAPGPADKIICNRISILSFKF